MKYKDELDKAMDRCNVMGSEWGVIGSLLCAHMDLNMAKDVLRGNFHYMMPMNPKYYNELVELKIKSAEGYLREAELQLKSLEEGFRINER